MTNQHFQTNKLIEMKNNTSYTMAGNFICLCLIILCTFLHFSSLSQNVSIGHTAPVARLDIRGVSASPSIPGITSAGIARIGVSATEGIDIGKMTSTPFIGWIQAGIGGTTPHPLSLQPSGGNVGIGTGTTNPSAKLHVNGTLKVVDGTQGTGKILTSDAAGLASWQSPPPPPIYIQSVGVCCQNWMAKNLNVASYRNGDVIPKVTDGVTWGSLTTGAYCYYNNDSTTYAATYGKLYNWYAVNDARGLAPEGWHIPTRLEVTTMADCLGGVDVAGGPMKEIGILHWDSPNFAATNFSGLTHLPGGYRGQEGAFFEIGHGGIWITSTEEAETNFIWHYIIFGSEEGLFIGSAFKEAGLSVRCIRD